MKHVKGFVVRTQWLVFANPAKNALLLLVKVHLLLLFSTCFLQHSLSLLYLFSLLLPYQHILKYIFGICAFYHHILPFPLISGILLPPLHFL